MDLSLCNTVLWKVPARGAQLPSELLHTSDEILCSENSRIMREYAVRNAEDTCPQWHDAIGDKEFGVEGGLLRAYVAGCGDPSARKNMGPEGGWLMSVCPVPSYANNVVSNDDRVCAPRHQAFMNQTRRGTGTEKGVRKFVGPSFQDRHRPSSHRRPSSHSS